MEERYLSLSEAADALDISERTAYRWIKSGKLRAYKPGRDYRIPESAIKETVEESEVGPKASASSQPSFNGLLEEERRATWEAAVVEGRRLRETVRGQVWKALSEWSASKRREEPYAARRKYLDEIGDLLQKVYEAGGAIGWAYIQAASSPPGGSDASVPSYLREESREMDHFYGKLFELVTRSGLSVRTGDDAAAAKQASADEAAAEHAQSETRPHRVEENDAA